MYRALLGGGDLVGPAVTIRGAAQESGLAAFSAVRAGLSKGSGACGRCCVSQTSVDHRPTAPPLLRRRNGRGPSRLIRPHSGFNPGTNTSPRPPVSPGPRQTGLHFDRSFSGLGSLSATLSAPVLACCTIHSFAPLCTSQHQPAPASTSPAALSSTTTISLSHNWFLVPLQLLVPPDNLSLVTRKRKEPQPRSLDFFLLVACNDWPAKPLLLRLHATPFRSVTLLFFSFDGSALSFP